MEDVKIKKPCIDALFRGTKVIKSDLTLILHIKECVFVYTKILFLNVKPQQL